MRKLVVVGNGMAGVACVKNILKFKHDFEITIFGEETHVNYNRILLSSVLFAVRKNWEYFVYSRVLQNLIHIFKQHTTMEQFISPASRATGSELL
jgi:NADPH-dependent 2,4-dienoyl-CoA reductase/sulfur reductase-like enzyme